MIKSSRLCRIMIKDIKTKISELNIDFDYEAYWEIIYLILLAFFVGMRFLLSTMFTIYWPKYFYRTLTVIGVVLVLMHLMLAKDIKKKEILAMLVVTFVFMMSHYVSRYDFLVDLLILILGAYRVNFRNILKTYIAVWSVLLVVTIIGAMTGLAENLVYYQGEGGERVRMALGICYPTDLAAYVAFLMFTYVCVRYEYITYLEIGVMAVLAGAVYYITDARTDFILMLLTVCSCFFIKKHYNFFSSFLKHKVFKKIVILSYVIGCCLIWLLTIMFDPENDIWIKVDSILSGRLGFGHWALELYDFKLFGQYIVEHGLGGHVQMDDKYFFIDSSFISIGLKYGLVFLILIVVFGCYQTKIAIEKNDIFICMVIIMIALQGFTEHHLAQYWYNPFILMFFTNYLKNENTYKKIYSDIGNKIIDLN